MKHIDINVAPGPMDPVVTIGYLEEWSDNPGTFDGWIEHSNSSTDELVINGASETWARYRVLRAYLGACLKEIDDTAGFLTKGRNAVMLDSTSLLAAVAEEIEAVLLEHARQG